MATGGGGGDSPQEGDMMVYEEEFETVEKYNIISTSGMCTLYLASQPLHSRLSHVLCTYTLYMINRFGEIRIKTSSTRLCIKPQCLQVFVA